MDRLRIGLIGWGTVGSAAGELIADGPLPLTVACIAVRNPERPGLPKGIPVVAPEEALTADVVVELAGGLEGPRSWARAALDRGVPYVTANKALLGSASVGGGTPMIETTQHMAATGSIARIRGVVNATTTYILSAMGRGESYDDALSEAQAAGYAEADPSFDVDGHDAAQKLAILASVAWGRWRPEADVTARGIVEQPVAPGTIVRLVADATPDELTVGPRILDPLDPLSVTEGVESMLELAMRDGSTVRVSGPGAGGPVTAGAVYADLARLVNGERPILFSRG